jgi:glutaredoxin
LDSKITTGAGKVMEAVIYSNGNQECERAKTLLEKLNFQIHVYKLNQHFSARGFVEEFGEEAEYPQVNVGFRHIGGLKDTLNYFKDNNLL